MKDLVAAKRRWEKRLKKIESRRKFVKEAQTDSHERTLRGWDTRRAKESAQESKE